MSSSAVNTLASRPQRLADFAAGPLGFENLLELFSAHALTSLGVRAVAELAPLEESEARLALARLTEMIELERLKSAPVFAGVTDPMPSFAAERKMDESDFCALREFASASERLGHWLEARPAEIPALASLHDELPNLWPVRERIDKIIDARGRVRDDASEVLARVRKEQSKLNSQITQRLAAVIARPDLKNILAEFRVIRRGGRSTVAVKAKSSGRVRGILHDRSQSEQTVFIEPQEVVEPQNRLFELAADERREVARIVNELARKLVEEKPNFEVAAIAIAKLELSWIAARFAIEYSARPALLPGERGAATELLLREARHPLLLEQERLGRLDSVCPIDLRLGAEFDLLLVTGPNTGGKTLALKTAGLFALMTSCGLPVPCSEGSTVPLYKGIVADIGDEQEIAQSLSTFSSHLVRIRDGLERAGPEVLVLLDELGGGTDPDEGAALGEAILQRLCELRAPSMVSTHLGRLKEFAFRNARAENASCAFDHETLRPLYRLLLGTPGESGALIIAKRLGISDAMIDFAATRLVRSDEDVQELMREVRDVRTEAERARTEAEAKLAHASHKTREIDEIRGQLEERSDLLEAEAQRGIEERVSDALRALERAQALLPQLPKASREEMEEALARVTNELGGASLSERRQAFLDSLHKGQFVFLPRYKKRCIVQKVSKSKRELVVKIGGMNMRVSFDEVTSYEAL